MGGTDPFKDYLAKAGLSGGQFNQNNPQYQFLLKQGQQALDRSAAARGMGYSGAQNESSTAIRARFSKPTIRQRI